MAETFEKLLRAFTPGGRHLSLVADEANPATPFLLAFEGDPRRREERRAFQQRVVRLAKRYGRAPRTAEAWTALHRTEDTRLIVDTFRRCMSGDGEVSVNMVRNKLPKGRTRAVTERFPVLERSIGDGLGADLAIWEVAKRLAKRGGDEPPLGGDEFAEYVAHALAAEGILQAAYLRRLHGPRKP